MNELLQKKLKAIKDSIKGCRELLNANVDDGRYLQGKIIAYYEAETMLQEIISVYENTIQSIEEDMRFLRGE